MPTRCPEPRRPLPQPRPTEIREIGTTPIVRIFRSAPPHAQAWNDFRRYGPLSGMRFDHHPPPPRLHADHGVMYAACRPTRGADPLDVVVLETFGEARTIPRSAGTHRLAVWTPARPLRLLNVSGTWLARAHGNAALTSGPRAVARLWARSIWEDMPDIDGIAGHSAPLPSGTSIVLFERAADAVPTHPDAHLDLAHPALLAPLARIASDYGLALL